MLGGLPIRMRRGKWIVILACLAILVVLPETPNSAGEAQGDHSVDLPSGSELKTGTGPLPSREPLYVSVRMKPSPRTLVAGESGSFEIEAFQNDRQNACMESGCGGSRHDLYFHHPGQWDCLH